VSFSLPEDNFSPTQDPSTAKSKKKKGAMNFKLNMNSFSSDQPKKPSPKNEDEEEKNSQYSQNSHRSTAEMKNITKKLEE
jgi:ribonuclease PH